jgi:hypothetical protein
MQMHGGVEVQVHPFLIQALTKFNKSAVLLACNRVASYSGHRTSQLWHFVVSFSRCKAMFRECQASLGGEKFMGLQVSIQESARWSKETVAFTQRNEINDIPIPIPSRLSFTSEEFRPVSLSYPSCGATVSAGRNRSLYIIFGY